MRSVSSVSVESQTEKRTYEGGYSPAGYSTASMATRSVSAAIDSSRLPAAVVRVVFASSGTARLNSRAVR